MKNKMPFELHIFFKIPIIILFDALITLAIIWKATKSRIIDISIVIGLTATGARIGNWSYFLGN